VLHDLLDGPFPELGGDLVVILDEIQETHRLIVLAQHNRSFWSSPDGCQRQCVRAITQAAAFSLPPWLV
jgi:hypothetical protein